MANKKKAPKKRPRPKVHVVRLAEKFVIDLALNNKRLSDALVALTDRVDSLSQHDNFRASQFDAREKRITDELARYTAEMRRASETRGDDEIMFLRNLVRLVFDGLPNTDAFLDRMGDVAHLFRDNVPTLTPERSGPEFCGCTENGMLVRRAQCKIHGPAGP